MSIEERTKDYKSHKHAYNVYVDINSKTKIGENLLEQYHRESKYHYMDVGRIGYHDEHGRYIIDNYTTKELIVVPKIIIRVTQKAFDRAGQDVYQLRTYMSKFGQLNFLLIVDRDKADLFLVENVYIENLNHKEDYETLLWRISYYNQKPVPLAEIFYKFGIKANPDDYGKAWKEEDIKINNVIVSKAKAEMTKQVANKVAKEINQKALVTSLNYLSNGGDYGKKVTKAYSETVAKKTELKKLATSDKLDNTLNNVLIKTVEEKTTKKDVNDKTYSKVYKKVLDVQMSAPFEIEQTVKMVDTKQNLKYFLVEVYQKSTNGSQNKIDENAEYNRKQNEFEKIIDHKFDKQINKEEGLVYEEKLDKNANKDRVLPNEFKDFDNKKVLVDLDTSRFEKEEEKSKRRQREREEKQEQNQLKKEEKRLRKIRKNTKRLDAECNLNKEFENSKTVLGLTPNDSEKKKKKKIEMFFKDKSNAKAKEGAIKEQQGEEKALARIEKKIKRDAGKEDAIENKANIKESKKQEREERKNKKKQLLIERKEQKKAQQLKLKKEKEEKKNKHLMMYADTPSKEANPKQQNNLTSKPVIKEDVVSKPGGQEPVKKEIKPERGINIKESQKEEQKPLNAINIDPAKQDKGPKQEFDFGVNQQERPAQQTPNPIQVEREPVKRSETVYNPGLGKQVSRERDHGMEM